jgi:hypothetical protein
VHVKPLRGGIEHPGAQDDQLRIAARGIDGGHGWLRGGDSGRCGRARRRSAQRECERRGERGTDGQVVHVWRSQERWLKRHNRPSMRRSMDADNVRFGLVPAVDFTVGLAAYPQ